MNNIWCILDISDPYEPVVIREELTQEQALAQAHELCEEIAMPIYKPSIMQAYVMGEYYE